MRQRQPTKSAGRLMSARARGQEPSHGLCPWQTPTWERRQSAAALGATTRATRMAGGSGSGKASVCTPHARTKDSSTCARSSYVPACCSAAQHVAAQHNTLYSNPSGAVPEKRPRFCMQCACFVCASNLSWCFGGRHRASAARASSSTAFGGRASARQVTRGSLVSISTATASSLFSRKRHRTVGETDSSQPLAAQSKWARPRRADQDARA